MYTQIINAVTEPLVFFFMFIVPLMSIYISYILANSLYRKYFNNNFVVRTFLPAGLSGILSSIFIVLSGSFAAGISSAECSIGHRVECGAAWWLAYNYIVFCIPAGIFIFLCALYIFRKRVIQVSKKSDSIGVIQKCVIFLFPVIFIGTFLLYLPTNQIAANIIVKEKDTAIAEQISKASENEYVCRVSNNEVQKSLLVQENAVQTNDYYQGKLVKQEYVGEIQGNNFIFKESWYPYGYENCYNSNGEDFMKKFSIRLAS